MALRHYQCCDEARLRILLEGDEQSDEFLQTAAHLKHCESCQQRLVMLAAETHVWEEVSLSLSEDPGETTNFDAESLQLDPPSHPEMLGRLGRYEVERVIGTGGMGVVVKAYDTELNRPAAIKLLGQHLAHNGAARVRFAREARAAAAVVHEHVVAIHNIESDAKAPFIVMQYVAGESLQERVDRQGPLELKEILRIGIQAAAGLAAAHDQGVVHRDVKPANILLEHGVERALLTDFGLARVADDATLTRTGIVAGTPNYMSPEQANGDLVDHRSDLFSLGAVLYFMATGRPPFRAERAMAVLKRICHDPHRPVWEINSAIPDELSAVVDRLLEKKPQQRYDSAKQVKQALSSLLVKHQESGSWQRSNRRQSRWSTRTRWLVGTLATACIIGLSVLSLPDQRVPEANQPQAPPPNSPVVIETLSLDLEQLLEVGVSTREKFDSELANVTRETSELETQAQENPATYLQFGDERWHSELEILLNELSRSEITSGQNPN